MFKLGGVAIFSKEYVNCDQYVLQLSIERQFEVAAITFQSESLSKIILIGLYRPPLGDFNIFLNNFHELLQQIHRTKFIIIGDFNINVINKSDPKVKSFQNLLDSFNLKWEINSPTRVTSQSATAIDNVVSNLAPSIKVDVLNSAISDHFAQCVTLESRESLKCPPNITLQRSTNVYNIETLNRYLRSEQWDEMQMCTTTDQRYAMFNEKLMHYINLSCPYKLCQKPNKKVSSGWITKGIQISRKNIKLYYKMLPFSQNQDFPQFFKRYKTIYRRVIKAAKSMHINRQFETTKCVATTAWNVVNKLKNKNPENSFEIEKSGNVINDPVIVANEFNTYFSNVANNVTIHNNTLNIANNGNILGSMFLQPVTPPEMIEVFKKLPPKRSTDINGISQWLLKQCYFHIIEPLTFIINGSFTEGVFPELCKEAKVIPVYKKGSTSNMGNYRPISLLPIIGKIFEKLYYNRLIYFLDENNIISSNQYGFRKGRCTSDAINKFMEFIVKSLDNQMKTMSAFLDLSKAFDCVHHPYLLTLLNNIGVRGIPLKWIESYLSDRKQVVTVKNKVSNSVNLNFGVPQGSILGPILFNIYINNCKDVLHNSVGIIQYADDTTLSFSAHTLESLEISGHENLNACVQYFEQLNLKTNISKTTCMNFKLNGLLDTDNASIFMGEHKLNEVNYTKFLGIYIDNKLCWENHIDHVCRKISSGVFLLRELRGVCSLESYKIIYNGVIHPYLSYGIIFWGSCAESRLIRAFVLQKTAIRVICSLSPRASCRNYFKTLNILTLPSMYIFETIVYSVSKGNLVQGQDLHSYNTRSNTIFRQNMHRLQIYEKLPIQAGIRFLNKLPNEIKCLCNELTLFKKKLKQYLLLKAPYSVAEFIDCDLQNNL